MQSSRFFDTDFAEAQAGGTSESGEGFPSPMIWRPVTQTFDDRDNRALNVWRLSFEPSPDLIVAR